MAAITPFIGIATSLISGIGGIMAAQQQAGAQQSAAQAQANSFNLNAQIAQNNAIAAQQAKNVEADDLRRKDRFALSQKKVSFLKGGVTLDGSPIMVLEEDIAQAETDALRIQHEGQVQATNFRNQATQNRYQAQTALVTGSNQAQSTMLGGYRSLIQ